MRLLPRNAGKLAMLGIAFTAIVMAATPEKSDGTAGAAAAPPRAGATFSPSPGNARQRLPEPIHVELERLARLQAKPDADPKPDAGPEPEDMEIGNVFGATSWYTPPPPSPPPLLPEPPPAPTAPPLPFTYLGRYEDAPALLAILLKGERMYVVAEGDVIEDTYRIDRLTQTEVELTYLPLDIKQSLSTGEAL